MDEAAAHAGTGHSLDPLLCLKGVEIAAGDHRQHACLRSAPLAFPAVLHAIGVDPAGQRGTVQTGTVGIIGIFDEQVAVRQRQEIDEAVGAVLGDSGVHDHGPFHAMRGAGAQVPAQEHLPAAIEMGGRRRAPTIHHAARLDPFAAAQYGPAAVDALSPGARCE